MDPTGLLADLHVTVRDGCGGPSLTGATMRAILTCAFVLTAFASQPASAHDAVRHKGGLIVNVKKFGAYGDGEADDTAAIQRAVDKAVAAGGGTVVVPAGTYMVNPVAHANVGIRLGSNVTLTFRRGAILKAIANSSTNYALISVQGAQNVTIRGGLLIGDRDVHTGTTGEWGNGVQVNGGSSNIKILGTVVRNCWGDGFYISVARNVLLSGITSERNRRQGLSIIGGEHIAVVRSTFRGTGGTSPELGIDIEPNRGSVVQHVKIELCNVSDNAGGGILVTVPTALINSVKVEDVTISRNKISGNGRNTLHQGPISGIELYGVNGMKVIGNTVTGNLGRGISISHGGVNSLVANRVEGNSL